MGQTRMWVSRVDQGQEVGSAHKFSLRQDKECRLYAGCHWR